MTQFYVHARKIINDVVEQTKHAIGFTGECQ